MKKIQRSNHILLLVSVAFILKAFKDQNMILVLVGLFIAVLAITRMRLFNKVLLEDEEIIEYEDSIMRYLNVDPVLYADMIELYKRGKYTLLYEERDGILMYNERSDCYLASALTLEAAKEIVEKLPQDYGVLIAHEDIFMKLDRELLYKNTLIMYNYVYETRNKFIINQEEVKFQLLEEKDIEIVKEHYSVDSLCKDSYIRERIKEGMLGAYVDNKLVGFIGMHDDGAIGMLEVFKEYQNRNIGTYLEQAYINKLIADSYEGCLYTQVNKENKKSNHLQEKLGFKKAKTPCYWYFS